MKIKVNKKLIVVLIIVLLIGITVGTLCKVNLNKSKVNVYVSNWNGKTNRYVIAKIEDDNISSMYSECWTNFSTKKSLDDFEKENSNDFVGDYDYYIRNYKAKAKLFYKDNNYYVIYNLDKDNIYCAECCCSVISNEGKYDIYIPTPSKVYISKELSSIYEEDEEDSSSLAGFMFDNVSFDEAVDFYSRMSDEYVTLDKQNKKITVSGYYNYDKKILDKFFTMDWNNKTYSYTDVEGKNIVYDEDGYHEQ